MKKPEFDPNKPLYKFINEMKAYVIKENEKKYAFILEFINKSTGLKLKSLLDFKQIDIEKINPKKFDDALTEYKDKLENELQTQITSNEIVDVIAICVESINYSVHRKRIVLEKKNRNSDSSDSSEDKIKKKKLFLSILNKPKEGKPTYITAAPHGESDSTTEYDSDC